MRRLTKSLSTKINENKSFEDMCLLRQIRRNIHFETSKCLVGFSASVNVCFLTYLRMLPCFFRLIGLGTTSTFLPVVATIRFGQTYIYN